MKAEDEEGVNVHVFGKLTEERRRHGRNMVRICLNFRDIAQALHVVVEAMFHPLHALAVPRSPKPNARLSGH